MRLALCCLFILVLALPVRASMPEGVCRTAIRIAEREHGLPPNLMAAIGRVESGVRNRATGRTEPYPWTINAEGQGSMFPSKPAAIAAVQQLQAGGMRSIDIGCMQINMRWHPEAFASLEEAFDPLSNARYAARFLLSLKERMGDWNGAVSAYHSQNPEFAGPYLQRVLAAMRDEQSNTPSYLLAGMPQQPPGGPALPSWTAGSAGGFMLSNGADRAQVFAAPPGAPSRSMMAYRDAPIAMIGRPVAATSPVATMAPAPTPTRAPTLVAARGPSGPNAIGAWRLF